jgi:putative ABC transport system permease protein
MTLLQISMSHLVRRKARLLLLVLGLAIAVGAVILLVNVSAAVQADIAHKLDEFGANILVVPKSEELALTFGGMAITGVSLDAKQLREEDLAAFGRIENAANISIVAPKLFQSARILEREAPFVGVRFENELRLKRWWRIEGRPPSGHGEALIGSEVRARLGLHLDQFFSIGEEPFVVTGVLEPTGSQDDAVVFIDLGEAQALFGRPGQLSLVEVAALCHDCPIEEIVRQVSTELPEADVMAIRQTIDSRMQAIHQFEHFSMGLSGVLLAVAALLMFTSVAGSVAERARDIGIFRAVGYRRSHIVRIILTETALASLLAGVFGYLAGTVLAGAVAPALGAHGAGSVTFSLPLFVLSVLLAQAVGLGASLYPAFKAARLDPVASLKAL